MTRSLIRTLAVTVVVLLSLAVGALRLTGQTHRAAYPNFACVVVANFGLCVGPPTAD
jgi:hypothetical protein